VNAVPDQLSAMTIIQMRLNLLGNITDRRSRFAEDVFGNFLVGKIDGGFGPGCRADQSGAPGLVKLIEHAFILAESLPPLSLGFGVNQIGQRFGAGEIQLAILDRPPGEFARLGWPQPGNGRKGAQQCLDDCPSPVDMEFGAVLAGEAGRPPEPQCQTTVDFACGIAKAPQRRHPRRRPRLAA
jgi:hypothetical protein